MQLMPLLLVMVVMAADNGLQPLGVNWNLPHPLIWAIAWGPVVLILLIAAIGEKVADRGLSRGRVHRSMMISDVVQRCSRWALLVNHAAAVLVFNYLGVIRAWKGNLIVIDEVLAILPPLVGYIGLFWIHYAIERRLRDASTIRMLDEGRPYYPTLGRVRYVVLQVRLQLLLTLVPVLLIVGLSETLNHIPALGNGRTFSWIGQLAALVGALGIFMFAPLLARVLLDVQPLAPGPIRADLQTVCDRHKVRMRDLLMWNTNGSMINAAVMGLIAPLRYVMITDLLLETLRREQVLAVMAHEIGHVRRHHMPWMVVCLLAAMAVGRILMVVPLTLVAWVIRSPAENLANALEGSAMIGQVIIGLMIFGWVSRRFERQADTFAAQHLSGLAAADEGVTVIQPESVIAMQSALQVIAVLNTIPADRPSWRHGSILWRQKYLASIIGKPVAKLPIDRVIRRIKASAAVIVVIVLALQTWDEVRHSSSTNPAGQEVMSAERKLPLMPIESSDHS